MLARIDDPTIAAIVGIDADVVAAYHDVFFDVRPILDHPDMVIARVFGERLYRQALDTAMAAKLLSFQGGPNVAKTLVAAVVLPARSSRPWTGQCS